MAEELPSPKSRSESYLAKAAGMDVDIPEKPESRLEQYLNAIAEGGGGGGTSDFDQLTNRPKYNNTTMTGSTNIPEVPTVVQTAGTSTANVMSQDATTKLILPKGSNDPGGFIKIGLTGAYNQNAAAGVAIGSPTYHGATDSVLVGGSTNDSNNSGGSASQGIVAVGYSAGVKANGTSYNHSDYGVALGSMAKLGGKGSIALGSHTTTTEQGQINVGPSETACGYNNSNYRLLTGLYDPQSSHDAATKGYVDTAVASAGALVYSNSEFNTIWENA